MVKTFPNLILGHENQAGFGGEEIRAGVLFFHHQSGIKQFEALRANAMGKL
jgi:hypothetical protein